MKRISTNIDDLIITLKILKDQGSKEVILVGEATLMVEDNIGNSVIMTTYD